VAMAHGPGANRIHHPPSPSISLVHPRSAATTRRRRLRTEQGPRAPKQSLCFMSDPHRPFNDYVRRKESQRQGPGPSGEFVPGQCGTGESDRRSHRKDGGRHDSRKSEQSHRYPCVAIPGFRKRRLKWLLHRLYRQFHAFRIFSRQFTR